MQTVTLYSQPKCVQCDATKRELRKHDVDFHEYNLAFHPDHLAKVKALGYLGAPVVIVDEGLPTENHWYGFNPYKLNELYAKAANQ